MLDFILGCMATASEAIIGTILFSIIILTIKFIFEVIIDKVEGYKDVE